jgi:hypothetical protein
MRVSRGVVAQQGGPDGEGYPRTTFEVSHPSGGTGERQKFTMVLTRHSPILVQAETGVMVIPLPT